jgi:hypothetical protein
VIIGWDELGDISGCDREGIRQALIQAYPDAAGNVIANWTGQLWRFRDQIAAGDLVVMPLKARPGLVAVGRVTGPYEFRPLEPKGFRHVRQTTWLRTDLPREEFHTASDLTFGNYVYLMRTQDNWAKLGWHVDREYFIDRLTEVRDVRSELMHFTPDPAVRGRRRAARPPPGRRPQTLTLPELPFLTPAPVVDGGPGRPALQSACLPAIGFAIVEGWMSETSTRPTRSPPGCASSRTATRRQPGWSMTPSTPLAGPAPRWAGRWWTPSPGPGSRT